MCQFRSESGGNPVENANRMANKMGEASRGNASLIIFGEAALQGYGLSKDCINNNDYWEAASKAMQIVIDTSINLRLPILFGYFVRKDGKTYNALRFYDPVSGTDYIQYKVLLPDADISDESEYVKPGSIGAVQSVNFLGYRWAFNICQDSWKRDSDAVDPVSQAMSYKPDFFINLSASPHYQNKPERVIQSHMIELSLNYPRTLFLYVPIVGQASDGARLSGVGLVVFHGKIMRMMNLFDDDMVFVDVAMAASAA